MANCLSSNKILAQDHENYEATTVIDEKVEKVKALSLSKLEAPRKEQSMKKKKKMRFNMQNGDGSCEGGRGSHGNYSRSGSVRIRVVVTQEELKRMLRCKEEAQNTSLEQLLHAVKLRGGIVSEIGKCDEEINSWKPSLDSIPEDHLI